MTNPVLFLLRDAFIIDFSPAQGLMDAGLVRCLALTGTQRWPLLPDVPTFEEQGYGLSLVGWQALFVSGATPDAVVDRLYIETRAILDTDAARKRLLSMALFPVIEGPEQTRELQRSDMAKWKAVIEGLGIKPE